jgi:hypothetical protein
MDPIATHNGLASIQGIRTRHQDKVSGLAQRAIDQLGEAGHEAAPLKNLE